MNLSSECYIKAFIDCYLLTFVIGCGLSTSNKDDDDDDDDDDDHRCKKRFLRFLFRARFFTFFNDFLFCQRFLFLKTFIENTI